ncbi:hypothetical protein ACES2L_06845 [Bdellovibrio bacteriovorus]
MRNLIIAAIYIGAFLLVSACSPESVSLRAEKPLHDELVVVPQMEHVPEQTFEWITEDGGQSQLEFNPRVDILFVVDNSDSMKSAQENLVKNIDGFTARITKNKMIDYHIGVMSVWDSSERYAKANANSYQIGELRLVKGGRNQNYRFVTKADGKGVLASTLNIGVAPFEKGGPEVEEMFSPLAAAIEKTGRGATNEDFFREDAQLVVVLVSDADDGTKDLDPEQLAQKLVEFKGGNANKVSAYGVLVRPEDGDQHKDWALRIHPKYHPECFVTVKQTQRNNGTCTGFGPERLEKFIVKANEGQGLTPTQIRKNRIMSIVSPTFGSDLAKIGSDITVKTLEKKIFLSQRPRAEKNGKLQVRVRYGNQLIPQSANGGWLYNPEDNSIHLSGDIDYQYVEGARFSVDLIPLNLKK